MHLYHFTTQSLDRPIESYPLDSSRPDLEFIRAALLKETGQDCGIWVWTKRPNDDLLRHFALWQVYRNNRYGGHLLEFEQPAKDLLSFRLAGGDCRYFFEHRLSLNDRTMHVEEFDICLVPVAEFRVLARVGFAVEWM